MRLYLDDDSVNPLLARLLRNAGRDVQFPRDVSLSGEPDSVHLTHAIKGARVLLTRNYRDFEQLHNLVNDPKRDLSPRGIVRAIAKLEAAGIPIADSYHILNQWR